MGKIGLYRVIVLILTSCLGIRWLPVAGSIGPAAIIYWLIGGLFFLLPLSFIVMELTANYEGNGGIQLWVKNAFGNTASFYVAWMYWINNLFFYPALVVFMVANFAYLIGNKELANNQTFVIGCVIIVLWLAVFINIKGVKVIANIAGFSCALNIFLGVFIILSGVLFWYIFHSMATPLNLHTVRPNSNIKENLSNLTLLMFALSGIELVPTIADSIKNSRKTISKGIVISIIIIMIIYIFGSLSINIILSPHDLTATTGLMESLEAIAIKLKQPQLAKLLILALFLVEFGALIVWLVAPTVMFFECVETGVLPNWLCRLNKKDIPANALYFIGISVTLIVILTNYLPSVNSIFTTLVLMGTIVYFLPYLILAAAYAKLKIKGLNVNFSNGYFGHMCAVSLFLMIVLGIGLSFIPGVEIQTVSQHLIYEAELIGGPLLFILGGYFLYLTRRQSAE